MAWREINKSQSQKGATGSIAFLDKEIGNKNYLV